MKGVGIRNALSYLSRVSVCLVTVARLLLLDDLMNVLLVRGMLYLIMIRGLGV